MPSLKALWHHGDDVAKTRAALAAACVAVGEIQFPFHTPRGEFAVRDPDG